MSDATERVDRVPKPRASFALTVTESPSGAAGARVVVEASQPSRMLFGSSEACAFRIEDDPLVSRRHFALDLDERGLRITDLESTNGTLVDGVAVIDGYLRGGEVVRVGETALRVDRLETAVMPALSERKSFGRVIGGSVEMRRLYPLCERLAAANVAVVIEGETGTGKEALAEALHEMGPRASGPYVVFDCTSVHGPLMESELFGHEKGAFTGAVATRKGVFELASGGTLLIDEIGDLDLALQPKLLRAVERGEIRRVGGDRPIHVDVRLLAATRRDLDQEVAAGRFREDLFHRLAVARVELPPLRRRRGDVGLLARHWWTALGGDPAGPPAELLPQWDREPWPGNVRELRNTIARRIALGDLAGDEGDRSDPNDRPPAPGDVIGAVVRSGLPFVRAREKVVDEFQRRYLEHVLAEAGGDTGKAAAASGIARRYFNLLRARMR
ncbi:MAG TPA: sigma 54-interacting transcriptional regulator [Polyangiaceae bacterium]|jgi:transcriptional regulator with GAF, ATPase, and Fis domain